MTQEPEQEGSEREEEASEQSQGTTSTPAFHASPATVKRRQRHLLERLRRSVSRQPHDTGEGMDKVVFGVAATATLAFVTWGFIDPHGLRRVSKWALGGTISNFGWLFVLSSTLFVVFVVFVAASRFGKIPLGGDGEEPEYSTGSWVSMMFATGMGIGLIFYGVGEPLYFYMSPPPDTVDPQTAKAASTAMGTALFHWTIYPWAMYALVGLGMAYGTYRLGRSQLFSAMFTSLFGRQAVDGIGGRIINILAIVATLFGSACSLGLGALQIGGGMVSTNLVDKVSSGTLVAIIAVLTACFVASAISGIEKGIQWLSNINMVLAVLLAIIVFIGGPTLFILNIIPSAIGDFIDELPAMASRTAAIGNKDMSEWLSSWTIFYWAWWISWTPFVGMFIARISRGRTIRQFVTGVMFVPSVVSLIWFAIFGGGAIGLQERAERAGRTVDALVHLKGDGTPDLNFDTILFDLLNAMPVHSVVLFVLMALAVVLVAIFFVTGADSASIVMGGLSENGATDPSRFTVVFWGVATGGVASAMLLAGGNDPAEVLTGLRDITIVSALPFVVVMLLLCVSLYKDLNNDPMLLRHSLANQVLVDSVTTAVTTASEPHEVETIELHTTLSSTADSTDGENGTGDGGQEPDSDTDVVGDDGAGESDGNRDG
nr:BCCT family transporter [Actinomyces sp. ZJ308]